MSTVTIRRGDTMFAIARKNGLSLDRLRKANPGVNPRALRVGQRIRLPGSTDGFDAPARARRARSTPEARPSQRSATRTSAQQTATRSAQRVPYRNGRIPSNALTDVGGGHRMYGDAAQAYTRMRDAARRDGVNIRLTDSYRSYAAQVDVARRKGIYGVRQPNGRLGLAARPGTSNHGLGRAVDVNLQASPRASAWLRANAARYGFKTIPREPWHWEFR
ncbi:MAG: D-alanyl-D-alanine carboxypeptidase family protein [Archangium sp.]|nr:D-alanyl-D-alanine carboxypeptidase family protein [Archangium sp.]